PCRTTSPTSPRPCSSGCSTTAPGTRRRRCGGGSSPTCPPGASGPRAPPGCCSRSSRTCASTSTTRPSPTPSSTRCTASPSRAERAARPGGTPRRSGHPGARRQRRVRDPQPADRQPQRPTAEGEVRAEPPRPHRRGVAALVLALGRDAGGVVLAPALVVARLVARASQPHALLDGVQRSVVPALRAPCGRRVGEDHERVDREQPPGALGVYDRAGGLDPL